MSTTLKIHWRVQILFALIMVALLMVVTQHSSAETLYYPPNDGAWKAIGPASVNWDKQALDAALDYAGSANSSGVVILLKGKILAERYWDGPKTSGSRRYKRMIAGATTDGHPVEDVASAQKSVVAFLAGVAEGKGKLNLDAPVSRYLGEGWSKAPPEAEANITVRHLMSMSSGLDDALEYQQPAGEVWRYNTGAYSKVNAVLEAATGRDIHQLTREWLTDPAGMKDSRWSPRPWAIANDAANKIGFATSARDLARFGLVIMSDGNWMDKDLLDNPSHLDEALSSSQEMNPAYGLLWWLNGKSSFQRGTARRSFNGSMVPTAPDDMVAAQGALGRKLYIVPSMRLIVTRLGDDPGRSFNTEFWNLLMKAAPR